MRAVVSAVHKMRYDHPLLEGQNPRVPALCGRSTGVLVGISNIRCAPINGVIKVIDKNYRPFCDVRGCEIGPLVKQYITRLKGELLKARFKRVTQTGNHLKIGQVFLFAFCGALRKRLHNVHRHFPLS